jgi:hypothetical protein
VFGAVAEADIEAAAVDDGADEVVEGGHIVANEERLLHKLAKVIRARNPIKKSRRKRVTQTRATMHLVGKARHHLRRPRANRR